MRYQVWAWDGHYIRGKKVGRKTKNRDKAIEKAETIPGFHHFDEESNTIWIEDAEGAPIGLIEIIQ